MADIINNIPQYPFATLLIEDVPLAEPKDLKFHPSKFPISIYSNIAHDAVQPDWLYHEGNPILNANEDSGLVTYFDNSNVQVLTSLNQVESGQKQKGLFEIYIGDKLILQGQILQQLLLHLT